MRKNKYSHRDYEKLLEEVSNLKKELELTKRMVHKKNYLIQSMDQELQLHKMTDVLTDSYNRKFLLKKYREAINMFKRWGFSITLCSFDLDDLEGANKKYGSDFGDSLLMSFSKLCQYLIRDDIDSLFRIEEDDFLVILIDCNKQNATRICQKIQREYNAITEGHTLSYGILEIKDPNKFSLEDYLKKVTTELEINKQIN
ncbi:MAG: GGDEF domain-containing protein [Clostridiales bacterium]|nr:GGDEF domain-containing protein [Clostridiales bacterium]